MALLIDQEIVEELAKTGEVAFHLDEDFVSVNSPSGQYFWLQIPYAAFPSESIALLNKLADLNIQAGFWLSILTARSIDLQQLTYVPTGGRKSTSMLAPGRNGPRRPTYPQEEFSDESPNLTNALLSGQATPIYLADANSFQTVGNASYYRFDYKLEEQRRVVLAFGSLARAFTAMGCTMFGPTQCPSKEGTGYTNYRPSIALVHEDVPLGYMLQPTPGSQSLDKIALPGEPLCDSPALCWCTPEGGLSALHASENYSNNPQEQKPRQHTTAFRHGAHVLRWYGLTDKQILHLFTQGHRNAMEAKLQRVLNDARTLLQQAQSQLEQGTWFRSQLPTRVTALRQSFTVLTKFLQAAADDSSIRHLEELAMQEIP